MSWIKGQSGNPAGRPKRANALARKIRIETRNGDELIEFKLGVLRGEVKGDRDAACNWLADRGWGKAVETIEIVEEAQPETAVDAVELESGLGPEGTVQ